MSTRARAALPSSTSRGPSRKCPVVSTRLTSSSPTRVESSRDTVLPLMPVRLAISLCPRSTGEAASSCRTAMARCTVSTGRARAPYPVVICISTPYDLPQRYGVAQLRRAALDELDELVLDSIVQRRSLVGVEHGPPAGVGAGRVVVRAVAAPPLIVLRRRDGRS